MTKLKTTNLTLVAKNLPLLLISTNTSGLFIKGSRVGRFSENKELISVKNKHDPLLNNNKFYCVG